MNQLTPQERTNEMSLLDGKGFKSVGLQVGAEAGQHINVTIAI